MAKLPDYNLKTHPVQIYDEMFHTDQAITAAGTTVGTVEIESGRNNGATQVAVVASGAVTIADAGALGLTINAAREKGGTYAAVVTAETVFTSSGGDTFADGELIGVAAVPDTAESVWKADLIVTGAANTGTVNVIPYYLPR